jgi:Pilus formation protein N terminal region
MRSYGLGGLLGLVVSMSLAACAAGAESDPHAAAGELEIFPPKIYTGVDGVHLYRAPIITVGHAGPVTWTIGNPALADIAPDPSGTEKLMIVAKAAGATSITATSGGASSTASLDIIGYTPQQYDEGMRRYMMGPNLDNPPCMECHAVGKGPDHTATELDADPDVEIQHTFLTGVDPEGRPIMDESEFAMLLKGKTHMWQVTETEKIGLVAYLRALEPTGFPEYDEPTTQK